MSDAPDLQFLMFKRRNGQMALAACRGLNKGCAKLRSDKHLKKPCPDCVRLDNPNETLGEVAERLSRGDS